MRKTLAPDMFGNIVYIGIGSNLGDAIENVTAAMDSLGRLPDTRLEKTSSLYRTTPIDADGDDYVNAVAMLSTGLSSGSLLDALLQIEQTFGRQRPYRNAPRTLDLDMLLYNADCISTERLTIPHPRMMERAFVLIPLAEIAPDIAIPGQKPLSILLERVRNQGIHRI